jgi:hypothetical protein
VVLPIVGFLFLFLAGAQGAFACTPGSTGYVSIDLDKDAYVAQAQPTTNFGTNLHTRVGYNSSGDAWHTYLHFPTSALPSLPSGCQAIAGYLWWNPAGAPNITELYDSPVQAQRAAGSWIESGTGGITWSNRPGGTGDYTISNPYLSSEAQGFVDISAPLVNFYNGYANNGIVLKPTKGLAGSWDNGSWWEAVSREAVRHSLIVVYYS